MSDRWPVNLHFNEIGAHFHEPVDTCDVFECRTGVWRPVPADARRDRIVRAAEAFTARMRDQTDVHEPFPEWVELDSAVAAGRETT